ncbi:serine--tRNA ligase [soil metagenome]
MLDPKIIRDQPDLVKQGLAKKHGDTQLVDRFLDLDSKRRALQGRVEQFQAELNSASEEMAQAAPEAREEKRSALRELSDKVKTGSSELTELEAEVLLIHRQIPNLPSSDVPEGSSDKENVVVKTVGEKPVFDFEPKDHEALALNLNLLDSERATKVSGAKFFYLKNELVILEQAVLRFALDSMREKGFNLLTVPHMAKAEAFYGAGHFSTPEDALEGDVYQVERDNLYLAGTAEIGLINYRSQEVVGEEELPLRYAGISPCYRREAGTYGKETRGLYRVHQFNKVEMVSLVKPADSEKEHEMLLGIAEELLQKLGLSYQVVLNCGGDLGHPQAKKWDIETWLPGMNKYGETHSCSNDTDWQARSLGIRSKNANGERYFVHTLNNTVLASPRILVAILENYQEADGSIRIPDALVSYTGFDRIAAA